MRKQQFPVSPPLSIDTNSLRDYTSIVQKNFTQLFQDDHTHDHLTAVPTSSQGSLNDIKLVTTSAGDFLYVKFPDGWKRFVPS